jgi:hypothetical protein
VEKTDVDEDLVGGCVHVEASGFGRQLIEWIAVVDVGVAVIDPHPVEGCTRDLRVSVQ